MPRLVDVENVGLIEVPDEWNPQQIQTALRQQFPSPKRKALMDEMAAARAEKPASSINQLNRYDFIPDPIEPVIEEQPEPQQYEPETPEVVQTRREQLMSEMEAARGERTSTLGELPGQFTHKGLKELFQAPGIELPKLGIPEDAGFLNAFSREMVNQGISLPEFFTSPQGIATAVAGLNPLTGAAAGGYYASEMLKGAYDQAKDASENWDSMTPAERGVAVARVVGMGAMVGGIGRHSTARKPVMRDVINRELAEGATKEMVQSAQDKALEETLPKPRAIDTPEPVLKQAAQMSQELEWATKQAEPERVAEPTALTPTKLEDTPLPAEKPTPEQPVSTPAETAPTEVADAGKKQSPMEMAGGEPPRPAGEMAEGVASEVRKPEGAQQQKPAEVQPADAAKAPEVKEKVVAAAFRDKNTGKVFNTGPFHKWVEGMPKTQEGVNALEQGFITDSGRFIDRQKAEDITGEVPFAEEMSFNKPKQTPKATEVAKPSPKVRDVYSVDEGPIQESELPVLIGKDWEGRPIEHRGENVETKRDPVTEWMSELSNRKSEQRRAIANRLKRGESEGLLDYSRRIESMIDWDSEDAYLVRKIINGLRRNLDAVRKDASVERSSVTKRVLETDAYNIENQLIPKYEQALSLIESSLSKKKPSSSKGQALGIVPQGSIILDKLINNKKLRSWLSRSFTKERGLPEDAYILELKRLGFTAEQGVRIRNAASDLRDSIADYLKLNRTLTSVAGFRGKAEPQLMRQINDVLNNNDSVNSLPPQLREPVMNMRNHINELQQMLLDSGMLSDAQLTTVADSKGTYLTRSYRVFDDPKWIIDNIPVDIVNNARRIIEAEYGVDTPQAMSILRNMFEDWKEGGVEKMFKGRKLGSKDLSALMHRNEHIRPEFLALMGEYKDPFVNYTRTAAKIARMIADHQFLTGIKEIGMGRFLFEDGRNPSGYNTLISSEGNRAMYPLNGLRTSEHMARVFDEWNKVSPETLPIIKAYYALNTFSKMSKTVYSAMTQSLNALGQLPMMVANGHYNPMYAREAVRYLRAEIGNNKRWREYQQKLAKHNLVREGVFYGELRDSLKDFSKAMADSDYAPTESMATLMMKNGLAKGPQTLYRVPDEFGKVFGWECEKARMRRDNPTWNEDRVETEAALRVRNTYPTYSNVSDLGGFTKLARRVPFVGPFFPFTYEAIRTTGHNLRYAWDDINSGKIRSGTERLVGTLAAVASFNLGAQALSRMLTGVSKEDDRDLRRQLPEYAKNDAFIYTGKRPGKMDFVNISRYNPYSYVSQPFIAAYIDYGENKDKGSALWEFAAEALRPFVGEQMLSKSIREGWNGRTDEGRDVFNPEDDWHTKWEKGLKHVLKNALLPGTIDRAVKRLMPAIRKEPGQESTPSKEIIAEFTGFRQQTHDFKDSILRKSGPRFVDGIRNSAKIFSTGIRSKRPSENILGQYIESEDARFRVFSDLYKDVRAALRQGVSKRDVFIALNESGVSKETARSIINGKYIPYKPSDEMINDARKVNKELPMREMGDIYRARSKMFLDDQRGQ